MRRSEGTSVAPVGYGVTNEERGHNRRVAFLVPLIPLMVIAALGAIAGVGVVFAGALGLGIAIACAGLVLGVLIVTLGTYRGPTHVERLFGARRIPEGSAPRVENLIDGLCTTMGVAHPPLFVVDEPGINLAMVAIRGSDVMVVTRGLLERLDLMELEGVLAHGLAHLRLDDVKRGTLAAQLPGILGNDTVRHRLAGRGRLLRADEVAAVSVRYPVGIASVLEKCRNDQTPAPGSLFTTDRFARTRWLWFDPLPGAPDGTLDELDAPAVRAQALAEW